MRLAATASARARERRGRVLVGRGAREIFAPAAGRVLEDDDPVDEPVGGDDLAHKTSFSVSAVAPDFRRGADGAGAFHCDKATNKVGI